MKMLGVFLAMGLVTYLPRVLPLLVFADRRLPPLLLRFLEGFPVAVLAAFVAPLILMPDGRLEIGFGNLGLVAAVPTAVVALRSRSLIATVVAGSALMMVLRAL